MNMKLFYALSEKLDKLLERHVALYFEERPWIEQPTQVVKKLTSYGVARYTTELSPQTIVDKTTERKQIELEINVVCAKIDKLLNPPEPVSDTVIQSIFGT